MKSICKITQHGTKIWRNEKDIVHREDGPAVEWNDGTKEWWINGKHHREDGPSIEYIDYGSFWYINGKLHREDGPACEYINGYKSYWLNGIQYTEEEYYRRIKLKVFW